MSAPDSSSGVAVASPGRREWPALTAIYVLASLAVLLWFLVRPGMTGHPTADFHEIVYGTAAKPFVYRVALPSLVRGITAITPEGVRQSVTETLGNREIISAFGWYRDFTFEFAVAALLMFACFVGFGFCLRALGCSFYRMSPGLNNLMPLFGYALLPLFFRYYSYVYDPGLLLSFALALVALVRRRYGWFIAAFVFACLNKETSVLLIVLYGYFEWHRERRIPAIRIAVISLIWLGIRVALMAAFRDNPGRDLELQFTEHNIWFFAKFPMAMRYTLVVVALFVAFLRPGWRGKPAFARHGLWIVLLPLVGMSLFFGFIDELRGYYEAFPFLYLLAIPTLARALGGDVALREGV